MAVSYSQVKFALYFIFLAPYLEKIAQFLANQNWDIFSC
jgi:hypothetical protein